MGFKIGLAERRKEKLEKELDRLLSGIIKFGVEKVILFGSLSSDNVHKSSDIDLVIVQKTKKRFFERSDIFYRYLKPNVAVDILVYTPNEFNKMRDKNSFMKSVLNKGRIIYEK